MSLKRFVKKVACVTPRSTVGEAAVAMKTHDIGAVVVVSDDNRAIGLLTDRDIALRVVAAGRDPARTPVEQVMTRDVTCLSESDPIERATETMRDRGVRRLPILSADGRQQVVGLVSLDDMLLLLGAEMGNLARAVFSNVSAEAGAAATHKPGPQRPTP